MAVLVLAPSWKCQSLHTAPYLDGRLLQPTTQHQRGDEPWRFKQKWHSTDSKDFATMKSTNTKKRVVLIMQQQPLGSTSKTRSKRSSSSSSSVAERRLNALDALSKKRTAEDDLSVSPLFADMDAAAMLLETFTQATNGNDDNKSGIAQKRMGSVPGAMTMSTLRQRAAEEGGYALSPRESSSLYSNSQSNQQSKRRAVASLIDKLDEKINEQRDFVEDTPEVSVRRSATENKNTTPVPKKRGRGRPRKKALPQDDVAAAPVAEVTEVTPLEPQNDSLSMEAIIANNIIIRSDNRRHPHQQTHRPNWCQCHREQTTKTSGQILPKSRRDETGNLIVNNKKSKGVYRQDDRVNTYPVGRGGNGANNELFNRYYKTELLTAKEEYSLGMKVKFMVKCEAVHEGLSLELDRQPTIAEWAAACGFTDYDAEICSENYIENDLDRQIRPLNSETEEMDPNMFVGNGLVNDSGVGRGKGRVKKPPPTVLGKFHDDSYEKFKKIKDESSSDESDYDEEEEEVDIFLYMQKAAPGQPINRGNPRIFREMILTSKEAKQRMVQCNMRLVMSIARRYHGVGVNVQDLVQEGSLGLARAAEKFDPKKGFKFSTYASWWIQQAVFRSIAYHSRTIRLHSTARQILQQELGRMPTNEEMADEMEMTIEKYNKMIRNTRHAISLEQPKYKNNPKDLGHESEASVGDMVDSSAVTFDENTPEQNVDHGLLHNDIQYMLGKLGEDERTVLCLRYGINDGITRTVTLVASEMRQTKSWVRSQECRALRKLRRPWYEKRLTEHRQSLQASHSLPL
ncbi:RNA polymerase sigma factor [Skeletonema marinoi]|uniref:RNA polymerase sigma factor n=1 Tax=Skeletonema marinoi TaxID=267567 RepID=A0AAD9D7B4_9STRA|nr:RNA polymerase sigma factor [Skeletonema marinoi]